MVPTNRHPAGGSRNSRQPDIWRLSVPLTALFLAIPILVVIAAVFQPAGEVWHHLVAAVLPEYVGHSLLLVAGVGIGTLLIGVSTAWLCTLCRFPGSSLFQWLLLLPMAMPAYIIAYT